MGITQQIGASSLIKPGVIDNTAARPASPYEGQVIFQKDTDQLLVWNGTAWVIPNQTTQNPEGLELIKTQTIGSGVTTVTVSDVFSSTYDNYKIIISGGAASATGEMQMRLGSTNTNYHYQFIFTAFNATVSSDSSKTGAKFPYVGSATTNGLIADITVLSPNLAKPTRVHAEGSGDFYFLHWSYVQVS